MEEIWKDIKDYEGLYQVSDLGNVKSLNRVDSIGRKVKEKIIAKCFDNDGYLLVLLHNNCNRRTFKVHRLVAQAFIDNPLNKPQVNHINGVKSDNQVDNLEWCTCSENLKHAYKNNLLNSKVIGKKGKEHHMYGKKGSLCPTYKREVSQETRNKLSIANKGKRTGTSSHMYGKKLSEETRQKIRIARLGTKASDEARENMSKAHIGGKGTNNRKVKCINTDKTFESIAEASRTMEINATSIGKVCRGVSKTIKGYKFIFID